MRGFHSSRIIGRGAPGNVYKVFFNSLGTIDVVKRSKHLYEGKTGYSIPEAQEFDSTTRLMMQNQRVRTLEPTIKIEHNLRNINQIEKNPTQ